MENVVQSEGLVLILSLAVEEGEAFESVNINLRVASLLLLILESGGEEDFGEAALVVLERRPGLRVELLAELIESDGVTIRSLFEQAHEIADLDAIERKRILELFNLVVSAPMTGRVEILQSGLRRLFFNLDDRRIQPGSRLRHVRHRTRILGLLDVIVVFLWGITANSHFNTKVFEKKYLIFN